MKTVFKEVGPKQEVIDKFPCIGMIKDEMKPGIGYELGVLFDTAETGMIIHNKRYSVTIGEYRRRWEITQFRKMRPGEEIIIKG